jgi:hypothetical protein
MNAPMNKQKWEKLKEKGVLNELDSKDAKDWVKRYKEGCDSKYGCLMYSASLERLRHVTFLEFYGGGIVD